MKSHAVRAVKDENPHVGLDRGSISVSCGGGAAQVARSYGFTLAYRFLSHLHTLATSYESSIKLSKIHGKYFNLSAGFNFITVHP
jgi:hypothetical protein